MSVVSDHREPIRDLVHQLVTGNFDLLQSDGRAGRVTAEQLAQGITEYGRTLVDLPEAAWDLAVCYQIDGKPGVFAVDLPLWTREEGRSDLTLQFMLMVTADGPRLEIDDLHVL